MTALQTNHVQTYYNENYRQKYKLKATKTMVGLCVMNRL